MWENEGDEKCKLSSVHGHTKGICQSWQGPYVTTTGGLWSREKVSADIKAKANAKAKANGPCHGQYRK